MPPWTVLPKPSQVMHGHPSQLNPSASSCPCAVRVQGGGKKSDRQTLKNVRQELNAAVELMSAASARMEQVG